MTLIEDVRRCMIRDLDGMAAELREYPNEIDLWALPPGFVNSTGTLAAHLAGNLRHFVGAVLGGSGYIRDREREFAVRGLSRTELIADLEAARDEVDATLRALDPARLDEQFPVLIGGATLPISRVLVHLAVHLGWHLGQADYHRRAVTGIAKPVDAVGLRALGDG